MKCDRKKPSCSQCVRKRMPCPGYWDPSAVVIRDQTLATARKAQARQDVRPTKQGRGDPPPGKVKAPYSAAELMRTTERQSPLRINLSLDLEDAATTFFLASYAPASPLAYLPALVDTLVADGLPTSAILAPALATLARELLQPSLMDLARKHYSAAIRDTNGALASPHLAVKDATLASVLLLAFFEAVTFHGRDSPTSWTVHIEGATELLKLRGLRQFDSVLGRKLFLDISNNIFASCAQRRVAVPSVVSELLAYLRDVLGDCDPQVGMAEVVAGMAELSRMFAEGPDRCDSVAIVLRACRLDAQISQLMQQLVETRRYVVVSPADAPESAYNKLAHQYSSPQACRPWNMLRMMRIFANTWIFRAAAAAEKAVRDGVEAVDGSTRARGLEVAASNAESMAADILGTVPYFYSLTSSSHARLMAGRWLIWPLSAVARSELAPVSARIYARNTLRTLGRDPGIPQAIDAANMLDEAQCMEDW